MGVSNVAVFGNQFSSKNNFETKSTGGTCAFASVFENLQQFDSFKPLCVLSSMVSCGAGGNASPTTRPTMARTPKGASAPTTPPPKGSHLAHPTAAPTVPGAAISPTAMQTAMQTEKQIAQSSIGFVYPTGPPSPTTPAPSGAPNLFVFSGIFALVLSIPGVMLFT